MERIPFFKKTVHVIGAAATFIEVKEAISTASNSTLPVPLRAAAVARSGCCTAALVTAYASKLAPNPAIANAFRMCCYGSAFFYTFLGGDGPTSLTIVSIASNSTILK